MISVKKRPSEGNNWWGGVGVGRLLCEWGTVREKAEGNSVAQIVLSALLLLHRGSPRKPHLVCIYSKERDECTPVQICVCVRERERGRKFENNKNNPNNIHCVVLVLNSCLDIIQHASVHIPHQLIKDQPPAIGWHRQHSSLILCPSTVG